ncbi:hypothetical protein ASPCAL05429 [Aspergillus calidoustus]|uniref:Guanine nucleotide-exchange factor SEC12 n=1 Tax=Aspergillus calidoustus TaxID=454130 RepID=A0A0U5FXP8_ASPCI|nr:hypothetical protein ASPCAL05429 [Aspergillus calidoustus]
MAPNIPSAKITLSCPLFAADFDPRNHAFLLVAGGGGEGRSGVGNKITLLNAYKRRELSEVVDIELSRDEDSVTSLAAAHANDSSIVAFAGINSSLAQQKQNKNRHLRSFQIDYPPRREVTESKPPRQNKPGQTINLSQESLFRTVAGPKGPGTYQRITRLSPWRSEDAPRVGAITTGLAPAGEVVFFNASTTKPGEEDVIGRIRLDSGEEAEDIDITEQDADSGLFEVVYTNGTDVFITRISSETRSNTAPDVKSVYSIPANTSGKGPKPKFRALRFVTPSTILLLQNEPDRKGSQLVLLDLRSSPAKVLRRYKLRTSIKIGLGLDVCNLAPGPASGIQQSIIAVSGSDQSLEILTLNWDSRGPNSSSRGFSSLRRYLTLRDVHPFSMTRICFSNFIPPAHPVTPETPPQYVKLASVSMGNTVVVHTFALSPTPPRSRNPHYVLVRPGENETLTAIGSTLTAFLSIVFVIFLVQAFTEIRGVMPPYLGISEYLPSDIRDAIAVPYNMPPLPSSSLAPSLETLKTSNTPTESRSESELHPLLRDLIPDSGSSLLISCNPSNNALRVEPHTPDSGSRLAEEALESESDSDSHSHVPRVWTDLPAEDRLTWKTRLINAGFWSVQEDEDESILENIFFEELCPQPQSSSD